MTLGLARMWTGYVCHAGASNMLAAARKPDSATWRRQGLVVSSMPERESAPGALCAEAGQRAAAPFPPPLSSACGTFSPLCSGHISLYEAEHLLHNRVTSVATLRWCSGPGTVFGFPPE